MLSELALGNKRQSYDTVSLTDDQDREETDLAETMLVIKPKIKQNDYPELIAGLLSSSYEEDVLNKCHNIL